MAAGGDTVATTLTHVFFELACNKSKQRALQAELDDSYRSHNVIPLLDATISETLRLHPSVPSGTQRITPPEGLQVGSTWIPGNTIIAVPSYTIFRGTCIRGNREINVLTLGEDPRAFHSPHEFIPERWTTKHELIQDESVFIPFGLGKIHAPIRAKVETNQRPTRSICMCR